MPGQDRALFAKNIEVLSPFISQAVVDEVTGYTPQRYRLEIDPASGAQNLVTDGGTIYQPDANTYALNQFGVYADNPVRFRLTDDIEANENQMNAGSVMALDIQQIARLYYPSQEPSFDSSSAAVCLGLGLGHHLPLLVEHLDFRDLIILEPEFEFFYWSLHALDWTPVVAQVLGRGGRPVFEFSDQPDLALQSVLNCLRDRNFGLIEGTYIYRHYEHPMFLPLGNRLSEFGVNLFSYNGWVEDEIVHLTNHVKNTRDHVENIIATRDVKPVKDQALRPAVITGSGPSLQANLDLLHRIRDRIVVFSAGTSIGPLLRAGIKPDFHCELENVNLVVDMLGSLAREFDFAGITLVASTTVDPGLADLFGNRIYFIREGDGVIRRLKGPFSQINGVGPSGVNTALRMAHRFGYRQLFLLGADFGTAHGETRYSKGVVYENVREINTLRAKDGKSATSGAGSTSAPFGKTVRGNFDAIVTSNETLIYMRHRLESLLSILNADVYNLGDGALIQGAQPMTATECEALLSGTSRIDLAPQRRAWLPAPKGRFYDEATLLRLFHEFDSLLTEFRHEVSALASQPDELGFSRIYDHLTRFMYFPLHEPYDGEKSAVRTCMTGSVMRVLHMLRYHAIRMPPHNRDAYLRDSLRVISNLQVLWQSAILDQIGHILEFDDDQQTEGQQVALSASLAAIRTGTPDTDWPWQDALKEIDQAFDAPYLKQYILKEHLRRCAGKTIPYPKTDTVGLSLLESCLSEKPSRRFITVVLKTFACSSEVAANPQLMNRLEDLVEATPVHDHNLIHFLATLHFFSGSFEKALAASGRLPSFVSRELDLSLWHANYLLACGHVSEAKALYAEERQSSLGRHRDFPYLDLYGLTILLDSGIDAALSYYRDHEDWHIDSPGLRYVYLALADLQHVQVKETELLAEAQGDGAAYYNAIQRVLAEILQRSEYHDSDRK